VQKESADDLAVLERLPADAINYRIHNQFIQLAKPEAWKSKQDWDTRRRTLVRELKDKVFRWFPQDKAPFETRSLSEKGGWADRYASYKEVEFSSEPGVPIRCQLFLPKEGRASAPTLLYVKRPGDTLFAYPLDLDELLSLLGRYNVIVLNPRMTEYAFSSFEYAEIERTASWIGRTVASMQVWDILRTAEWIRRESGLPASPISVYGKGPMGILGLYAGLFDEGIQQVILDDPPASHWSAPALLNVLRITDIPEVAGAFAPRQLVSLTPLPHSFDYARRIYQQHSQGTNFRQAASLPEALEVWKH
jgi:hypothetical protein